MVTVATCLVLVSAVAERPAIWMEACLSLAQRPLPHDLPVALQVSGRDTPAPLLHSSLTVRSSPVPPWQPRHSTLGPSGGWLKLCPGEAGVAGRAAGRAAGTSVSPLSSCACFRLRALSSGGSVASPPPSPAMPKYKLADYRYGREEMLALYVKENKVRWGWSAGPSPGRRICEWPLSG